MRREALIREKGLDQRETQVLNQLSLFLENKEIADRLDIPATTVEMVLRTAGEKLGVHKRAEAIVLWRELR